MTKTKVNNATTSRPNDRPRRWGDALRLPWAEAQGYLRTPFHGGRIASWNLVTSHCPNLRRLTQVAKRLPHVAACFSLRTRIVYNRSIPSPRYVVEEHFPQPAWLAMSLNNATTRRPNDRPRRWGGDALRLPWAEAQGYVRTPFYGGRIAGWNLVTSHCPNRLTPLPIPVRRLSRRQNFTDHSNRRRIAGIKRCRQFNPSWAGLRTDVESEYSLGSRANR